MSVFLAQIVEEAQKIPGSYSLNAARVAIEACARVTFEHGCICSNLAGGGDASFRASGHYGSALQSHDPRCPRAIAQALRGLAA